MKKFRVYADDWRDKNHMYVLVYVWPTRKGMNKHIKECNFGVNKSEVQGQCSGFAHYRSSKNGLKLTGLFAYMWLNEEDLQKRGMEIITHECTHAAMRHMTNHKVDLYSEDMAGEEALAYTIGSLSCQVNKKLYKHKIFT